MRLIEESEFEKEEDKREIVYALFEAVAQLIVYLILVLVIIHSITSSIENITKSTDSQASNCIGTIEDLFIERDKAINRYVAVVSIKKQSYNIYIKQNDFLKYRIGDTVVVHVKNQNYSITTKLEFGVK